MNNKKRLISFSITIISLIFVIYFIYYNIILLPKSQIVFSGLDKFGIKEVYPTANGGREWFIDMANPKDDPIFQITGDIPLVKNNSDDSLFINNSMIRINAITPKGYSQWKNIEMTGYVKAIPIINQTTIATSSISKKDNGDNSEDTGNIVDIDWRARGGMHNSNVPCEGTSLNGGIYIDGTVAWKKEIWHTGGYTDARGVAKATNSIADRWIGWKIVIYNIQNNKSVKMESYLDDKDNNQWIKVDDIIDNGGWFANSPDSLFYSADCGKPKDYVITNGGPIATFRADNTALNFKDLSIREIQAPD